MNQDVVLDLFREAFFLIVLMSTILILPALVVGLMVSIFQAATQINEQTLSFLPRFVATISSLMLLGPWMLTKLTDFIDQLFRNIPYLIS
jgi:flagellar biosynthetic protein FliQ